MFLLIGNQPKQGGYKRLPNDDNMLFALHLVYLSCSRMRIYQTEKMSYVMAQHKTIKKSKPIFQTMKPIFK